MPTPLMSREQVLDQLLAKFRARGYDATSLSDIATATGLGRSSLYHHFPHGKEQMAADVLAHLEDTLERNVFEPLRAVVPARKRFDQLMTAVDAFYAGGKDACLLERLAASSEAKALRRPLQSTFRTLMTAFEESARDAGLSAAIARNRAEDAVIRIEGALVLCAALGETGPFERVMRSLKREFLEPPA